jgi:hypothetical protein
MKTGGKLEISLVCRPFFFLNYKMKNDETQLQIGNNNKG